MEKKVLRELRKCTTCPRYFWSVIQPNQDDNIAYRLRFCNECWNNKLQKPTTLHEIEYENADGLTETEKQAMNTREEAGEIDLTRRYKAN